MTEHRRANKLWKRLNQTYGARFLDQFGPTPSDAWIEAIDSLTDEQVAYGLRKGTRDHPVHPPPLGAFVQACNDMPVAQVAKGPTLQEQLCAYVTLTRRNQLTERQFYAPWTYLYHIGVDPEKPKHLQRTAECVGVRIEHDGESPGHRVMVVDMQMDTEWHNKAMKSFTPGPKPKQKLAVQSLPSG